MVTLGAGNYTYETSGEDWGKLPQGWTYKEATAVAVDSQDRVYVYSRSARPMAATTRPTSAAAKVLRASPAGRSTARLIPV